MPRQETERISLRFSDPEAKWLQLTVNSNEMQAIIEQNAARVIETDLAGNATKSVRGRTKQDGAFVTVAEKMTDMYLQVFNLRLEGESKLQWKHRKRLPENAGRRIFRKTGETEAAYRQRIDRKDLYQVRRRIHCSLGN